ncbi:MAG: putative nucleic acid-binding protein, contains PIN domain protein [halophilic archaeon J07HB67]|nr:MAG: putative nucleic acid-binding protein, contains PIN domain protein [halophilic archaeon J07HB67]
MRRVVVDTNVLFGAAHRRDQWHDRASELLCAFDNGDLSRATVVSPVLFETLDSLRVNTSGGTATELLNRLQESRGFDIQHVSEQDLENGRRRLRQFTQLSLTDAVIGAWMERTDTQYLYSFDSDFDVLDGITRLDSPHDPYR